ncbi:MAG: hypothetical protein NE330_02775 [Lentisphaeraceae bacterium]|nr:hypothetical protein [Lentisphaeraceae bacterium]
MFISIITRLTNEYSRELKCTRREAALALSEEVELLPERLRNRFKKLATKLSVTEAHNRQRFEESLSGKISQIRNDRGVSEETAIVEIFSDNETDPLIRARGLKKFIKQVGRQYSQTKDAIYQRERRRRLKVKGKS